MYKIYIVGNDWGEFGKFVAKYDTLQQAERRIEKDALKLVRELHYVRKNFFGVQQIFIVKLFRIFQHNWISNILE